MKIEQLDRHYDLFDQRLRKGDKVSVEKFVEEHRLPVEDQLMADLRKLEHEYQSGKSASAGEIDAGAPADQFRPTDLAPAGGDERIIGNYKLLQKIGEGGMGVVYMAE